MKNIIVLSFVALIECLVGIFLVTDVTPELMYSMLYTTMAVFVVFFPVIKWGYLWYTQEWEFCKYEPDNEENIQS